MQRKLKIQKLEQKLASLLLCAQVVEPYKSIDESPDRQELNKQYTIYNLMYQKLTGRQYLQ